MHPAASATRPLECALMNRAAPPSSPPRPAADHRISGRSRLVLLATVLLLGATPALAPAEGFSGGGYVQPYPAQWPRLIGMSARCTELRGQYLDPIPVDRAGAPPREGGRCPKLRGRRPDLRPGRARTRRVRPPATAPASPRDPRPGPCAKHALPGRWASQREDGCNDPDAVVRRAALVVDGRVLGAVRGGVIACRRAGGPTSGASRKGSPPRCKTTVPSAGSSRLSCACQLTPSR